MWPREREVIRNEGNHGTEAGDPVDRLARLVHDALLNSLIAQSVEPEHRAVCGAAAPICGTSRAVRGGTVGTECHRYRDQCSAKFRVRGPAPAQQLSEVGQTAGGQPWPSRPAHRARHHLSARTLAPLCLGIHAVAAPRPHEETTTD